MESQNGEVELLTAKLKELRQETLALKEENQILNTDNIKLTFANSKLQQHSLELTMKIDMLKTLDHRVEEKRKNYSSD
jgi:hypothetical protein